MKRLLPLLLLAACGQQQDDVRVVGETASDRIELRAENNEPVVAVHVAEGSAVRAGDPILEQDARRAEAGLDAAEAAVLQHKARLDELQRGPRRERIDQARAELSGTLRELEFRKAELERIARLEQQKLASPDALDAARAAFDSAEARHALRRAQLDELLSGTTVEELAQAEQALAQSEALRDAARVDLERHTLFAPVDGIADSRLVDIGERPVAGQAAFVLLGGEQVHARVYIPEPLRVRVQPGTAATIYVDGKPGGIPGRVRWVSSDPAFTPYYALTERDRGRLSYEAKIDIVDDIDRLPDGIPVEVALHPDGRP